ncbi:hypothetical protein BO71DRAFT_454136 [Aspergillus ellipticus CBS 707.79]|uniref:Uncharacterized protein n=1 Tax=Aspergillus ellipticus CBS 707.79 TaxID=1448320 RepID=A0A319CT50_9EURO|nr:hypothetical protein BO71DRAFT_454136 [Aspergillus ellipticus CBS 707.79]
MPRGYRSATEYCFDEEQADAIVRATAYHRKDYCPSVIWYSPQEHIHIRPSIATPFQRTSRFRQINLRSTQIVDSLNQNQRVVSNGLNLLCALLRTRLADDISLLDFYNALCIKGSPETQVRTLASVRKQFRMTKVEVDQPRSFKSLPGIYSMNETVQKSRITIVSLHRATLTCRRQSLALAQTQPASFDRNQKFNFMGSFEHGISYIIGTRVTKWGYEARDKVYAQDGFLDHFRWCEQAQLLWRSSGEGKSQPPELPVSARTGGYFRRRE